VLPGKLDCAKIFLKAILYFFRDSSGDGKLFSVGDNSNGQLGIGSTNSSLEFQEVASFAENGERIVGTAAGTFHSFAWTGEHKSFEISQSTPTNQHGNGID
jgi:alpha-tubulin suppressor-like RCC1 family protein